jgi:hypothetical protein
MATAGSKGTRNRISLFKEKVKKISENSINQINTLFISPNSRVLKKNMLEHKNKNVKKGEIPYVVMIVG